MDKGCQDLDSDPTYLLAQLSTARNEISNLRQQIKNLRYLHEKDVNNIKRLLGLCTDSVSVLSTNSCISKEAEPSTSSIHDDCIKLKPIGVINTWFPSKRGTPRQPVICGKAPGKVTLFNTVFTNPEHSLEGLHEFSHMWILFYFHRNDSTHIRAKVAPPRLNGIRTGVFSTRSPHRPCPVGLSLVKIIKIEHYTIYFEGVDMVDQTPVLDIKPYIPQYDNPLHIQKLQARPVENANGVDSIESINERLNSFDIDANLNNDLYNSQEQSYCIDGFESDISRDEEIALSLQAEEFQESSNFNNFYSNYENNSVFEDDRLSELNNGPSTTNVETMAIGNSNISSLNSQNIVPEDANERTGITEGGIQNTGEEQNARSSRLLDGADGPSTVCSTDIDLVSRRALNSRLDNSPIRMGVREAPDGEEGFESQTITPTQQVGPSNSVRPTFNNSLENVASTTLNSEIRGTQSAIYENVPTEVRVPDWISRPETSTLTVVFNDRAVAQLNDILGDKTDEEKEAIRNVLREDPRSAYLRQRWGNQFYTFLIHDLHITCKFDDNRKIVTIFQIRHAGRMCECGEPEWQCSGHSPVS